MIEADTEDERNAQILDRKTDAKGMITGSLFIPAAAGSFAYVNDATIGAYGVLTVFFAFSPLLVGTLIALFPYTRCKTSRPVHYLIVFLIQVALAIPSLIGYPGDLSGLYATYPITFLFFIGVSEMFIVLFHQHADKKRMPKSPRKGRHNL